MKKSALFLGVLAAILFTSCEDLMNQLGVDIESDVYEAELIIPATNDSVFVVSQIIATDDINAILEEKGYDETAIVNYIEIKEATVEVMKDSPIEDLSAIDDGSAAISSDSKSKQTVCSMVNNGAEVTKVAFTVDSDIDVEGYLSDSELEYELTGNLNKPLEDDLKLIVKIKFGLNVNAAAALGAY
ncbi:MAG: hypothetical protein MI922_07800 [Bacteroidales bacterium]|nr:hypothetical protein [Bacteroidales bacterium]